MKSLKYFLIGMSVLWFSGCSENWLDVNTDPINSLEGDPDLLLPGIQSALPSAMLGSSPFAGGFMAGPAIFSQQYYQLTLSRNSVSPADNQFAWQVMYTNGLNNLENYIQLTDVAELGVYAGIGKILKAYYYIQLVDLFGEVPYSEASQGAANFNPAPEDGAVIYDDMLLLLQEAVDQMRADTTGLFPEADIYYDSDTSAWVALANSLRLRIYNKIRLVDPAGSKAGIDDILTNEEIITDNSQDFEFHFGTTVTPLSQHPWYDDYYPTTTGTYMSNFFMNKLLNEYGVNDPRTRFFIYRQSLDDPDPSEAPCATVDCPIGYLGEGFVGRDAGDPTGLPPDQSYKSVMGVYPVGGLFDDGQGESTEVGDGAQGAGIYPVLTNAMMKFTLAEAALTLGTTGDPRVLFEQGIRASINKVISFASQYGTYLNASNQPGEEDIDAYVDAILEQFDAADESGKLSLIIDQAYIASFGNATEGYTNYRRTGFPELPPLVDELGPFPNVLLYPTDEVSSNANLSQHAVTDKVFWDID